MRTFLRVLWFIVWAVFGIIRILFKYIIRPLIWKFLDLIEQGLFKIYVMAKKQILPHQYHRAKGTVKRTEAHVTKVKSAQARERDKHKRNPKFGHQSKKFIKERLAQGLGCEACGARRGLQTHHIIPFHTDPSLEMDKSNWIVLCEYVGGLECHENLGHGDSFHRYNPHIRADAAELLKHPERWHDIKTRAKKNSLPNRPKGV